MNLYALLPLITVIAYIPLLFMAVNSRPWNRRNLLFVLFLLSAMAWSCAIFIFRGQFFLHYSDSLFRLIVILFSLVGVQFHSFTSSFFAHGYSRWLIFSYVSLVVIIAMVLAGFVTGDVIIDGEIIHGSYRIGVIMVFLPLLVLAIRNFYVFGKMLKGLNNPILYNQILSLILSAAVLVVFTSTAILPWGKNYPIPNFGNLIVAVILSYAVIRHSLVDIKLVLRQGTAWASLTIIGMTTYWLLLITLKAVFNFELNLTASFVATIVSVMVSIFVYRLRKYLFELMGRAFHGSSYEHRQRLSNFSSSIHNVFSLKEQGGELLTLLNKAIGIKQACLLFPEQNNEEFAAQFSEPNNQHNKLRNFTLKASNPIVKYLERERKPLSKENLSVLPVFLGLWTLEKEEIQSRDIEVLIPLISRDKLIAILVLGKKVSGRYSLEDLTVLDEVTGKVAVSIEKEYLREQLREREEELSVINRSTAIITSSLDIQEIFGSFIEELKLVVDVSWATIVLVEEDGLRCVALSSTEGAAYQIGDKIPSEGSGTGWVVRNKRPFYESDISKELRFTTGENFRNQGLRTMVYLPLISKGEVIGSLIIASKYPDAYNQRHIKLLEQLASQIAMPLENAQLYARAEAKARIDELTGLLNRRTLDEMIDDEINRHARYGGVFSLAILDLDSFKTYNDTYGHPEGDILLRQVGGIIKNAIRNADRAFRYGGDEFAILLPQTTINDAIHVTERVRDRIAADIDSRDIKITASIGLANWPDDGVSHTDIIAAADVTLYRAKRSGGNQSYYSMGSLSPLQLIDTSKVNEMSIDKKTISIVYALAEAIDLGSSHSYNHSKKVAEYALELGKVIKLKPVEISRLEISALLRDIGKISIGDQILNKTEQLTPDEWEIIRSHPQLGATIAERIPELTPCIDGIYYHHERYDGKGYPDGLKGDKIPLEARILALADSFAAMTSNRPYASKLTYEEALKEIEKGAGNQFDPQLAETFVSIYSKNLAITKKTTRR